MINRIPLREVRNATGRIDVALYRIAQRVMENAERDRGVRGLQENLLPIVEQAIHCYFPKKAIPPELLQILAVWEANCSR